MSQTRRLLLGGVALVVLAVVLIAITDPFAGRRSSTSDYTNADPTGTTRVSRENLTSQTQVSATLGYAGSYTVSLPAGTTPATLSTDEATVQSGEQKVAVDESALSNAKALNNSSGAATLLGAEATVTADEKALSEAKAQLSSDKDLGCPVSSAASVTTPTSGGGASSSGNSASSSSPTSSSPSSNVTAPSSSGSAQTNEALNDADTNSSTASSAGAPSATTDGADQTTSSLTTLSGTVNPNGSDTSYAFDYGTTASFGSTTTSQSIGAGTSAVSVSTTITDLKPDTTYEFALVATNARGTSSGGRQTFQTAESSCVAQAEVVSEDVETLASAKDTLSGNKLSAGSSVTSAQQTLTSDEQSLSVSRETLSTDESDAVNPGTTFTDLPELGALLHRGETVYSLDAHPVPLFYSTVTPYRALFFGVSPGPDVAALNANLAALGFGSSIAKSDAFTGATELAVKAWQASLGESQTGIVGLGDFVDEPGAIQVDTVTPTTGAQATAGTAVLTATSTTPVVTIDLDASLQSDVKVGDPVTITLPDNSTTSAVISEVSTAASSPSSFSSSPSSSSSSSSSSTITVLATLPNPKAASGLNQAPVEASITNASASNVLAVPVDALLALADGGYAIEEIGSSGVHHLLAVTLGLFDDQAGKVQVSGSGLAVGQKIVIPNV